MCSSLLSNSFWQIKVSQKCLSVYKLEVNCQETRKRRIKSCQTFRWRSVKFAAAKFCILIESCLCRTSSDDPRSDLKPKTKVPFYISDYMYASCFILPYNHSVAWNSTKCISVIAGLIESCLCLTYSDDPRCTNVPIYFSDYMYACCLILPYNCCAKMAPSVYMFQLSQSSV